MTESEPVVVQVVRSWARLYTRGLAAKDRERRCLELESDMWEHLHDPDEPATGRAVFGRFLRGIPADVRWRYRTHLEARGAHQRSLDMSTSLRSHWWVILTAFLGAAVPAMSLAMIIASGAAGNPFAVAGVGASLATGGLILIGLLQRRTDLFGGSRLIFAGALLTLVGGFEFIPIGLIVLISGFWTGNLQLSESSDAPDLHVVSRQQVDMTAHWFVWLGAAAALFAIGWLPLVFDDPDTSADFSFGGWYVWALSWFLAMISAGVGVILTILRFVVRHRTQPA